MNTIFFLVFFMYLPDGSFTTAYRGEPFQSLKECKEIATKDRMQWENTGAVNVRGVCVEFPKMKDSHHEQQPAQPRGNYL